MSKGKIKTILFLVVFLLVLAVVCNLLIDLSEQKKAAEAPAVSNDPYIVNTPSDSVVIESAPPVRTPAPTVPYPKTATFTVSPSFCKLPNVLDITTNVFDRTYCNRLPAEKQCFFAGDLMKYTEKRKKNFTYCR